MTSRWRSLLRLAALALVCAPALAHAAPTWVFAKRGQLPPGAFVAGDSGTVLCRAKFRGGVHPGKVFGNKCFLTNRNGEVGVPDFEVLVGVERSAWIPAEAGRVPADAYVGGQDGPRSYYVCRGPVMGMVLPGKLVGTNCSVSVKGKEILLPRYEVLVMNPALPPPATTGLVVVTGTPAPNNVPPPPPAYPPPPGYPPAYPPVAQWVDVVGGSPVPAGAFAAGEENGRPLLLCRAPNQGGWHPGKVVGNGCNFGYGGQELAAPRFQVLTNLAQAQWLPAERGLAAGAFVGGNENGRGLVVCRGSFNGGTHPGKLVGRTCHIGWNGQEVELARFELLFAPAIAGDAYAGTYVPDNGGGWGRPPQPPPPPAARWADAANGVNPAGAFVAGDEQGRPVILCRGQSNGGWFPGRVTTTGCNFGAEGQELTTAQYQVLTNLPQPQWVPASGDAEVPAGAFMGGLTRGRPHAVCRGVFNSGTYPGRVTRRGCSIGLGGQEIMLPRYDVLVAAAIDTDPVFASLPRDPNAYPPTTAMATSPGAQPYPATVTAAATPARWIDTDAGINPAGAFVAGQENGKNLVLCRATYSGGVQPGKVVGTGCNFGYGGTEMIAPRYQVLANLGASQWMAASDGYVPPGAFVGGTESGRGLVVCRATVNGGVHPGKVVGNNCNVGWGGREMQVRNYEVLVAPTVP